MSAAEEQSGSPNVQPRGVPGALPTADLAPTGRAKCIGCGEAIAAKSIRIAVERQIDTGRFVTTGAGYLHPACVQQWAAGEELDLAELCAKVAAHSALPELPAPFGSAAAVAPPVKKEAEVPAGPLPPFEGASEKTLREVAKKLDKAFDPNGFKHNDILEKAGIAWERREAAYWYLSEHRLVAPEKNSGLLNNLVKSLDQAPTGVIVPLLGRLTATHKDLFRNYSQDLLLLPRWISAYDELTVHALRTERAALEAAMDTLPPDIRLGVAFVRGRSGLPITDAARKAIYKHLVQTTLTKEAAVSWSVKVVKDDAVEVAFELRGHQLLPRLAALFIAGDEAWSKAVEAGLAKGTWTTVAQVAAGLQRVPLEGLVTLVGKRDSLDRDPGALFAILDARHDDMAAVIASARALPTDYQAGAQRILRELMLVWALSRCAARGEPVDPKVTSELLLNQLERSLDEVYRQPMRDAYLAIMRALSKEDALALVRRQLAMENEYYYCLPILAVHFDDALLRALIAQDAPRGYLSLQAFILIGTAALPALIDAYKEAAEPKARDRALAAIVAILGHGTGPVAAPEQAALTALGPAVIDCSEDSSYWASERRDAAGRLLQRLAPTVRRELLLTKLRQSALPERPYRFVPLDDDRDFRITATRALLCRASTLTTEDDFDVAVRAMGAQAPQILAEALGSESVPGPLLRRLERVLRNSYAEFAAARGIQSKSWLARLTEMCAEADGDRECIYLLEPSYMVKDCDLAPRAGSWSQIGGSGPGIPTPTRRDGEPMEHALTIDLQEAPELAKCYPGARALALYVPDRRSGEDYKSSKLVAVPEGCSPPTDGEPLFVLPLQFPSAAFDRRAARDNALLSEVRTALFNRSGWALGEPIWIQHDEGDTDLIMQLSEHLGLNLGDCGSLYVFPGSTFMQCH